ncbi:MAG: iron complex outerrane recepter protein [Sphingomonadales bacterium]|jgi:iron complex outermembrane receptor protein|nr:iron complex outerrane recepter protein [Sphingomonadales bacterium]
MRHSDQSKRFIAVLLGTACLTAFGTAAQAQGNPARDNPPTPSVAVPPAAAAATETADNAAPGQVGDIVVTAERRETRLQETPIAVSVVSGADLQSKKLLSVADLTTELPNVNINTNAGMTLIAVRGLGIQSTRPGDDPRIAFYQDDVYVARNFAQSTLFDVDRIEVARGPQGTLFGRNATGGAFSVTSRLPTADTSGYFNVTTGNHGLIEGDAAIGGPVTDTLGVRFAVQAIHHSGYGKNVFTGNDVNDLSTIAFRTTALWKPSSDFSARLIGYYNYENDASYAPHIFAPVTPGVKLLGQVQGGTAIIGNFRNIVSEFDPTNRVRSYGANAKLKYNLSSQLTAEAVLGYQHGRHVITYDTDGTEKFDNAVFLTEDSDVYSAELHLIGNMNRLHWTAGLYFFHENEFVENRAVLNAASFGRPYQPVQGVWSNATLDTKAWAAFAQATYDVTDQLSITLGGRYSDEVRKDLNETRQTDFVRPFPPLLPQINAVGFPRNQRVTFNSFNPKVTIDYKITRDVFAYASYTTGFKSGGFNYGQVQGPFLPEKIKAYEAGIKTTFLDRHARFNVSAFQYNYTNIQTSVQFFVPVTSLTVVNAGGARIRGVEAEFVANPTSQLSLDLSASLLDAKYTSFMTGDGSRPTLGVLNLKGNTIPQSPKYSINAGVSYTVPIAGGGLTFRGEYQRVGRVYHTVFNLLRDSQAPYDWVNAFITYNASEHWSAGLFVRNLTNSFVKQGISLQSGILGGGGGYSLGSIEAPRTFGASLGYKF